MMTEIESSSQLIDYWLYMHFENDEGLFLLLSIIAFVYLFVDVVSCVENYCCQ